MVNLPSFLTHKLGELYRSFISPEDQLLLNTVFDPSPTQEKLDACLGVCDIEVMGGHKTLLLSYFTREHPELRFSEYSGPRVRGLLDFFRFANMKLFAHFCRIGGALRGAGIPLLVFKGAAMRMLRPELPRAMGDIDVLVPPDRFLEAAEICGKLGYREALGRDPRSDSVTALDFLSPDGGFALDIHKRILALEEDSGGRGGAFCKALFARARPRDAFGIPVLLPGKEDILFILLTNLEKNLRENSSIHSLFFSLADCRFLLGDQQFAWDIVKDNMRVTRTEFQCRFAAEFMHLLVPDIIPDKERRFPLTREWREQWEKRHNRAIFDWQFLETRIEAIRRLLLVEFVKHPGHYLVRMVKLVLLRKLRAFPPFIRWYLRCRNAGETDAY